MTNTETQKSTKVPAKDLKAGSVILVNVDFSENYNYVSKGSTNGKSIELKINSIEVEKPILLKSRGVNGKRSSTDYSKVKIQTERGEIELGKNLKITVIN